MAGWGAQVQTAINSIMSGMVNKVFQAAQTHIGARVKVGVMYTQ
jgi:hypothetical protein